MILIIIWYNEREDFSEKAIGISMKEHHNSGFVLLRGNAKFEGQILGGYSTSGRM